MYVRWKVRSYRRKYPRGGKYRYATVEEYDQYARHTVNWMAYLVQSERHDGQPRQRTVAYLGCLNESRRRERNLKNPEAGNAEADQRERYWFWGGVQRRLDTLVAEGTISPDQRATIETQVQARVLPPSAEEWAKLEAERAAWDEYFAALKARVK